MNVNLDEIWALAKQHAVVETRDEHLPTIDPDHKPRNVKITEGGVTFTVKFHIDNTPAIHYTVGDVDDLVYVDVEKARNDDSMTGPFVSKEEFKNRVRDIVSEQAERYN